MEKNEIIKTLLENGGKSIKALGVKNVTITPQENYVRVALTLDKAVRGMITEDSVNYTEGEVKVIFVSLFSIISVLKEDDSASFACNHLIQHPEAMNVVLSRAKVDIIQENVVSGQEYKNPWSETADTVVFDHDTIINHIVGIHLSDFAVGKLDKLADSLLGF